MIRAVRNSMLVLSVLLFALGCATDGAKTVPAPDAVPAALPPSGVQLVVRKEQYDAFTAYRLSRTGPEGEVSFRLYNVVFGNGRLWVGADGGLIVFDERSSSWAMYGRESGMPGDSVTSVVIADGKVVCELLRDIGGGAAKYAGAYIFNERDGSWTGIQGTEKGSTLKFAGGRLWMSAYLGVTRSLDMRSGAVEVFSAAGHLNDSVSDVAEDGSKLWFSVWGKHRLETKDYTGGGVAMYDTLTRKWEYFDVKDGLARPHVTSIEAGHAGVWAAHQDVRKGLSRYDAATNRWEVIYKSRNGISLGGDKLLMDGKFLWMTGDVSGFVRLDTETLDAVRYMESDGLPGYIAWALASSGDAVWGNVFALGSEEDDGVRSSGVVKFNTRP